MAAQSKLLARRAPQRPGGRAAAPPRHRHAQGRGARALDGRRSTTRSPSAWGGRYINDFIDRGRVKRVYVQADAPYRMSRGLRPLVRAQRARRDGAVLGLRHQALGLRPAAAGALQRHPGGRDLGQAAPGRELRRGDGRRWSGWRRSCRRASRFEWTGQSYQERAAGAQTPLLYSLSLLVVFLCLAALYESWSIPTSVLLVVPLGILGAVLATLAARPGARRLLPGRRCSPPSAWRARTRS